MDFIDDCRTRSGRFRKRLNHLKETSVTEEATKTSFVLPFIQMLGYDIFDPAEVVPEFTADIGTKKNEKVDYALIKDGCATVLIECKRYGSSLSSDVVSQLLRYFHVTEARIGILTDGITYRFYSDLDQENVMDPRPFFEFNMLDYTDAQVRELKRFTKEEFDKSQIIGAARELRYLSEIKRLLARELANPSDEFVKFVIRQVHSGPAWASVLKMFHGLTHSAFNQFISEKVQDRLTLALKQEGNAEESKPSSEPAESAKEELNETEDQALSIMQSILRGLVDADCMSLRKLVHYTAIVLHTSRERDDYGTNLFRLKAKKDGSAHLTSVAGFKPIHVNSIGDLYEHKDTLRDHVSMRNFARPPNDQ